MNRLLYLNSFRFLDLSFYCFQTWISSLMFWQIWMCELIKFITVIFVIWKSFIALYNFINCLISIISPTFPWTFWHILYIIHYLCITFRNDWLLIIRSFSYWLSYIFFLHFLLCFINSLACDFLHFRILNLDFFFCIFHQLQKFISLLFYLINLDFLDFLKFSDQIFQHCILITADIVLQSSYSIKCHHIACIQFFSSSLLWFFNS